MKIPRLGLVFAVVVPVLLLSACQPEQAPNSSPTGSPQATASASPTQPAVSFPADGLLNVTATVTADNGAALRLSLMVHSSIPAGDQNAAARISAIATKCDGELDASLLGNGTYGLLQVDYSATLVGTTQWPAELNIMVLPTANDLGGLASAGDLTQIAVLAAPAEPGDYVPHCKQNAFLSGPGSGTSFIALDGDATNNPPFDRWADFPYGFTANSPAGYVGTTPFGGADAGHMSFSGCVATTSPLASTLGYPSNSWTQEFASDHCAAGGATQSLGSK